MNKKEIYLAGGCFWGVQAYFENIDGVLSVRAGYANGDTPTTTYEKIKETNHAECVKIEYDEDKVSLQTLLKYYFHIIDPTILNRQGNDIGVQYRTGIYYTDENDLPKILEKIEEEQKKYEKKIVTEVKPLLNYNDAEEYHQDYLKKNPNGYCHVDLNDKPVF